MTEIGHGPQSLIQFRWITYRVAHVSLKKRKRDLQPVAIE